ncbi:cation-transporting ATPase [Lacticaseibacillus rhamnosus MTCC 5462]|nr:cation-transporting ATPase [Lacticaseibacillus rhamnosus MTCC 5462]
MVLAVIWLPMLVVEGYKRRQHRDELAAWQQSELIGDAE